MTPVRDAIIEILVNDYSVNPEAASVAVDNAFTAKADDPTFGNDTVEAAANVANTPGYWTFSGTPKPVE